ncbi:MAG TPA: hypothetical protein VGK87_06175 [Anaerolineae bacterium]
MFPLFLYLTLDGLIKVTDLLVVPSVYLLVNTPVILHGRTLQDALAIYLTQVDESKALMAGATTHELERFAEPCIAFMVNNNCCLKPDQTDSINKKAAA